MNRFSRGDLCPAAFAPLNSTVTRLNIKRWTLDDEVLTVDLTHTGTLGFVGRIGQKRDCKGTVEASLDLDLLPWTNPGIAPGTNGVILVYISPLTPIQIPVIVKKLHSESAVENEVRYSFDWELNIFAGAFVYPIIA